jgi:hypothetical protein
MKMGGRWLLLLPTGFCGRARAHAGTTSICFSTIFLRPGEADRRSKEAPSHDHGMEGAIDFDEGLGVFNTNPSTPKVIP